MNYVSPAVHVSVIPICDDVTKPDQTSGYRVMLFAMINGVTRVKRERVFDKPDLEAVGNFLKHQQCELTDYLMTTCSIER